jgi:drug/metabolite transporter (DMT)-like permease
VDRARPTAEAVANRSFSSKAVGGVFAFFAVAAFACDFNLRRLRKRGRNELSDPRAYRRRLAFAGAMLAPFLILIFGWHGKDALQRGESLWPVVLAALLALSVLGGTAFYVLRYGPAQAGARSARLLKWVAPIAGGVAALRLLAWLVGWQ